MDAYGFTRAAFIVKRAAVILSLIQNPQGGVSPPVDSRFRGNDGPGWAYMDRRGFTRAGFIVEPAAVILGLIQNPQGGMKRAAVILDLIQNPQGGAHRLAIALKSMKTPYVYIMTNKPRGTLYIGVTSDLVLRVWQHRNGLMEGFSKRYGLKTLVWMEQHESMESAIAREKILKYWRREWKIRLIDESNPSWRDLYTDIL